MGNGLNKTMAKKIKDGDNKRETSVEFDGVTKSYTLHHQKPTLIEQIFKTTKREKFVALDNISLKIFKGEKVAIIGSNGSGKTTMLKIIARITNSTFGSVKTEGKVVSLIDLTAGFHPELTGYENIFLNGLLIGMSKQDIKEKIDEIVEFTDIGKFIYSPIFTYSEGMKLRLGFSVAIFSEPDILVLDEGLMAGDSDFHKKSGNKIKEMFKKDKTIIVVSHWLSYLEQNCNRFIYVKEGKIEMDGGKEVINYYKNL